MNTIDHLIPHLLGVQKPAQYLGGELNAVRKDPSGRLRVALAFPDLYEIGMSYTGLQILYHLINREDRFYGERVFAPWPDMAELLRTTSTSLFTLETRTPLSKMDVLGFTFQYELSYSNFLMMLELAGIPILSKDRDSGPLVMAGGPCIYNPEPIADFVDVFYVGEAERELVGVLGDIHEMRKSGISRTVQLKTLHGKYPFLYIPAFHPVSEAEPFWTVDPAIKVTRTIPREFYPEDFPDRLILPNVAVVYDRITLEISRGCDEGCRFCQAGMIYRPARERAPEDLLTQAHTLLDATGHDEISLSSLSTADYPGIEDLVSVMVNSFEKDRISTALPSIRADRFQESFAEEIKRIRKTGFTIAPEAGSQRLRDVINKNLTEESILKAAETAYHHGWSHIKLYFMMGLPTETLEDLDEMIELTEKIAAMNRRGYTVLSVSTFVPKPHTPFQWTAQLTADEVRRRQNRIKSRVRSRNIKIKLHDPAQSILEGIFSRGDRHTGNLLLEAYRNGACFDGWTDKFKSEIWEKAISTIRYESEHLHRELDVETPLPWDFMDISVPKSFFVKEWSRAKSNELTPMCVSSSSCNLCRACTSQEIKYRFQKRVKIVENLAEMKEKSKVLTENGEKERLFYEFSYKKGGLARFVSHLDLVTIFSRALRIAKLPVMFSRGFNPRPILKFSPALELGISGDDEHFLGEFVCKFNIDEAVGKLNLALPDGIRITMGTESTMAKRNRLSRDVDFVYEVTFPAPVRLFLGWREVEVEKTTRKGTRHFYLGDVVQRVQPNGASATVVIRHSQQRGSLKLSEALPYIFPDEDVRHAIMLRKQLIFLEGDA
ncbi:MAG: TIGR03960 family B12-binding radical SAM protein [Acidobacteria bacterium]|nr:TIGR03960 family B12-binding radical SAM protein [Acidobacteriota bacterium]